MNLAEEIRRTQVSQGELMICWLGQAGYLLKDGHGCTLAVDPYLTNCGERIRGFKRLSPMLLPAEDFAPDYYVITHTHFDHLDYDAIPVVKERSPKTQFFGPTSCLDVLAEMGVEKSRCHRLDRGMRYGDRWRRPPLTTAPWRRTPSGFCWRWVGTGSISPEIQPSMRSCSAGWRNSSRRLCSCPSTGSSAT